jgi:hypothetical protein
LRLRDGVQALACIADAGGQGLLHRKVCTSSVFVVDLHRTDCQIVGYRGHPAEDILAFLFGDDALRGLHGGVDPAGVRILGDHPVGQNRMEGLEIMDARIERLGETVLP